MNANSIPVKCGPCIYEGITTKGTKYCPSCEEYLCDKCTKHHQKFALLRKHIVEKLSTVKDSSAVKSKGFKDVQRLQEDKTQSEYANETNYENHFSFYENGPMIAHQNNVNGTVLPDKVFTEEKLQPATDQARYVKMEKLILEKKSSERSKVNPVPKLAGSSGYIDMSRESSISPTQCLNRVPAEDGYVNTRGFHSNQTDNASRMASCSKSAMNTVETTANTPDSQSKGNC